MQHFTPAASCKGAREGRGLPNRRRRKNGRQQRKSGFRIFVFSKSSCLLLGFIGARASRRFPMLPLPPWWLMIDEALDHVAGRGSSYGGHLSGGRGVAVVVFVCIASQRGPGGCGGPARRGIETLCAATPEALAHSPSQMPLSCPNSNSNSNYLAVKQSHMAQKTVLRGEVVGATELPSSAPGRPKLIELQATKPTPTRAEEVIATMPGCGPAGYSGHRAFAHTDTPNTSPGCRSCASAPSPAGARPRPPASTRTRTDTIPYGTETSAAG